jgi:2-amino-4-hydroxy-6-hydroxymethyldihydropteridine diphosphokinase
MVEVYLALGTNLGDRAQNLEAAISGLSDFVDVKKVSPTYETEPKYVEDQPQFFNLVVAGRTELAAMDLLERLKALETSLGRTPSERFGPRLIDLDIIFYGEAQIDLPDLTVPHPGLAERAFVLRPLADIAPTKLHPASGKTVKAMLHELPEDDGIKRV